MKKTLAVLSIAMLPFANVALADKDIGCGVGTMVFEGKKGKIFKVLAATTNGTSGNQTFGISTGTLGCDGTDAITSAERLALFIDGNMDGTARDMARGEGDKLAALAEAWGIEQADQPAFYQLTQNNFAHIFTSENVTSKDVLSNLNQVVASSDLAQYAI